MSTQRIPKKNDKETKELNKRDNYKTAGVVAIFLAILFPLIVPVISPYISRLYSTNMSLNQLDEIGGFLAGTTGSLLVLASILFILSTIEIQREDLKVQMRELKLTNDTLKQTMEAHEISNKMLAVQQFENTFFNLVTMHGSLINDLKMENGKYRGREVINKHFENINTTFETESLRRFFRDYTIIFLEKEMKEDIYLEFLKVLKHMYIKNNSNLIGDVRTNIYRLENRIHINAVFNENMEFFADYDDMAVLMSRIPENEIVQDYKASFLRNEENIYQSDAVVRTMNQDNSVLSNYLKSTSAILKFVDQTNVVEDHERYIEFFASQLSDHEITVLHCYSHFLIDGDIQTYFNKYSVFKKAKYADGAILANQLLNYTSANR